MKIESIAVSTKKGTQKKTVGEVRIKAGHGIVGDAHAGPWHRQISFLAMERIEMAKQEGLDVAFGSYAENIATSGIDWPRVPIGTRLSLGDAVIIEITQIGKKCHQKCAIYYQAGDCIMPTQGVFGKVIAGGDIRQGDRIRFIDSEWRKIETGTERAPEFRRPFPGNNQKNQASHPRTTGAKNDVILKWR